MAFLLNQGVSHQSDYTVHAVVLAKGGLNSAVSSWHFSVLLPELLQPQPVVQLTVLHVLAPEFYDGFNEMAESMCSLKF